MRKTFSTIKRQIFSLKGVIGGLALGYLAKSAIDTAAGFERMQLSLDTITKGEGAKWFEELNTWALKMPINTEKAIQSFIMMRAMGLEPTIEEMTTLVDTTSALGGSEDTLEGIARALGQMATKGKVSAEELMQLAERGVPVFEILKDKFGEVETSSLDANEAIGAIFEGLDEKFGGQSDKMQNTWKGLTESLKSYWKEFVRMVMQSGVMSYLEERLAAIMSKITEWSSSGQLQAWAAGAADAIVKAFAWIEKTLKGVYNWVAANWSEIIYNINETAAALKKVGDGLSAIARGAAWTNRSLGKLGSFGDVLFGNTGGIANKIAGMSPPQPGKSDARAQAATQGLAGQAKDIVPPNFRRIKQDISGIAGAWKGVAASADAAGKAQVSAARAAAAATQKAKEEIKRLLDTERANIDVRRRATEEMYREAGIGAEANARMEVQKLLEKTSQWQRAGVEIENINEYLHGRLGQMQDEAMSKGQTEAADYYDIMRSQGESLLDTFQETQNEMMNQLAAVDESLAKDRVISVEDFASDKLQQIKALLAQIKSKTVKVKVDHSGTGSTERPLTEKISEIQGMYEEMPTGMKFSADMTDVTAKVRAIFADVNREASHYGAMRRELWTNEPGSALYQINQRRQRALRKRGFTGDVITKQTVSQQLAMSRTGAQASGQAGLTIQGGVHVTVSGADTKDPETLGQKLADALDRALSTKIKYGRSGIPAALAYT